MSEPDFLSKAQVAILGLGLMGGSLALALHGRCRALVACDPDENTVSLAQKRQIVDRISPDPASILPESDVIVLAAPIHEILALIEKIPTWHPGGAIVLDLGSTKNRITQALEKMPARFDPIGGHPMCGKETGGLTQAQGDLFEGTTFAFTPLPRTSQRARALAEDLARATGSRTLWLDAATHDRWTAATSHLPYLVASALTLATPPEAAALTGPGFRSTTRVAATPSSIMLDVLATNRENLFKSLGRFREQLNRLEEQLKQEKSTELKASLDSGARLQRALNSGRSERQGR
jgi:prephenate dehydrogenase